MEETPQGARMAWFCPLADDVGNAADWAAVVVAFVGAIAVFVLSRSANATAREVKKIQDLEAEARKKASDREARLILIYLEPELRQTHEALNRLYTGLDIVGHDSYVVNGFARGQFKGEVDAIALDLSQQLFSRLHVLKDSDAADIAMCLGGLQGLRGAASAAADIDLSEVMPGVHQASFDEFRRGVISTAFETLRRGCRQMTEGLERTIQSAVKAKQAM